MGVSVSEGTITKWLKSEGEHIGRDEPLLEISTDKVDTEVPSPARRRRQILVQEGETVEVGTVLAVIAPEGSEVRRPSRCCARGASRAGHAGCCRRVRGGGDRDRPAAPTLRPLRRRRRARRVRQRPHLRLARRRPDRLRARRRPGTVQGTGTGGRVTKKDILAFLEGGAQARTAPAPATGPTTEPAAQPAPEPAAQAEPAPVRCSGPPTPPARAGTMRRRRRRPAALPRLSRAPSRSPARRSSRCPRCARESPSTCAARSTPRRT